MVEINIKEIGNIISVLDDNLKNYNDNNIELMNTIKSTKDYWKGNEYSKYIELLNDKNYNMSKKMDIVRKKCNLYKFIYNEYKDYGNKIEIEVDSKEKMLNKINNCINLGKELEKKFNILINSETDEQEKEKLNKKLSILIDINRKYNEIYKDVKKIYEKVKNNELRISSELDDIEIEYLEV